MSTHGSTYSNRFEPKTRAEPVYIVVYDPCDEDNKIYGMMEFDLSDIADDIHAYVKFYNDEGNIDLKIREVSQSEYETYIAFDLFPILTPYARQDFPFKPDTSSYDWGIDFHTPAETVFKVRFRDY